MGCGWHYKLFWAICDFQLVFCPKNKIFKKEKSTWIYHHFTPASQKLQSFYVWFLKNDADSITGYSWSIFTLLFHFCPKLKFSKNENTKITKNALNVLNITIVSHVVFQIECGQAFCQFWAIFFPLPIFGPKIQKFRKTKKKAKRYIIIISM